MLMQTIQTRGRSKRWIMVAGILVISLASIAWGFDRLLLRTGKSERSRTSSNQKAEGTRQRAARLAADDAAGEASTGEATMADSDSDAIPDIAELRTFQDRDSFRRWFTAIAEIQFYQLSPQWNADQRDCAGLVRFAMREALRRHDRPWFQRMGQGYETVSRDVAGFDLDHNPLGEKIFRTDFGSFHETDLHDGRLADFADGRALKNFNTAFIGRDRRAAQPGDLLFFYQPWVQKFPYHVMIFLGVPRVAANGGQDWVVYHTGPSPTDEGTVKKVQLSVLDHHPDPRWRPIESNKKFLGFYRLKILE